MWTDIFNGEQESFPDARICISLGWIDCKKGKACVGHFRSLVCPFPPSLARWCHHLATLSAASATPMPQFSSTPALGIPPNGPRPPPLGKIKSGWSVIKHEPSLQHTNDRGTSRSKKVTGPPNEGGIYSAVVCVPVLHGTYVCLCLHVRFALISSLHSCYSLVTIFV